MVNEFRMSVVFGSSVNRKPNQTKSTRTVRSFNYKANNAEWYNPKYSWYCTGYAKHQKDEPRPFVSMEKDPLWAKELLTYLDSKSNSNQVPIFNKR